MAKKAVVERQKRRERQVAKFAERRADLLALANDLRRPLEERLDARHALALLPRDANPVRLHNRCAVTGRPRGYIRYTGMSRIAFRELALKGELPGIRKASF